MRAGDAGGALEVGEGARHPQHPVIAACREAQALRGALEECETPRVGGGDLVKESAVSFGIGADALLRRQCAVAAALAGARRADPAGDGGARFGRRR